MYGIAYVIIPTEFASLQGVLDEALAPFRRGGVGDLPHEPLAFDDVTEELRRLHRLPVTLTLEDGRVVLQTRALDIGDFDFVALHAFLVATDATSWTGRLSDVEPDFDAFVLRFTTWKTRDAQADGYGTWLNPLGRWDWWELGGRFDGLVSGQRRTGTGSESMISSGPSGGRDLLGGVVRALGGKPSEIEAEIAANIDIVSALLEAARRGEEHAFPTAVVLPVDACESAFRWFDALGWRPIPAETKAFLSVPADASFKKVATAAYQCHAHMAVAGIAYHF